MLMGNTLELRNVSKSFPGVKALDDVRFELKPAEIHGLMGENGAGKSTLIKILSGIYYMDSGRVLINGKEVDITSRQDANKNGISVI